MCSLSLGIWIELYHAKGHYPNKFASSALRLKVHSPGGVLPYMGYIGMCGPKGYGFPAVLVINRVSILADFGHFGHK